jgi:DnaJ-class molecular chaperone
MGAFGVAAAIGAAGILTKNIGPREPNRCVCDRCRGKGFDRFVKNRAARKCPRCRGEGYTEVGNTKR